jgi:hypothetical protein
MDEFISHKDIALIKEILFTVCYVAFARTTADSPFSNIKKLKKGQWKSFSKCLKQTKENYTFPV